MTAQRQERNGIRRRVQFRPAIALIVALAGLSLAGLGVGSVPAAWAATTERVVANRFSGLAIEGYDPVAYFVDARPLLGLPELEAAQAGVVWRFRNEGNRASFVAHPDIYGPQFGGYDPVDLARGVTVAGRPLFWLGPTPLFIRHRGAPGRLCGRPAAISEESDFALAGARGRARAIAP